MQNAQSLPYRVINQHALTRIEHEEEVLPALNHVRPFTQRTFEQHLKGKVRFVSISIYRADESPIEVRNVSRLVSLLLHSFIICLFIINEERKSQAKRIDEFFGRCRDG